MTSDTAQIKQGIDALTPGGGMPLYDAVYAALEEVAYSGSNDCRALVVMGKQDDGSGAEHALEDIVNFAYSFRIRIFTICVASACPEPGSLDSLAHETGGEYYHGTSEQSFQSILAQLRALATGAMDYADVIYTSSCADGVARTVSLTVQNVPGCPGTATATKVYNRPLLDSSQWNPLVIRVADATVHAKEIVEVPVSLETSVDDPFRPTAFDLVYNTQALVYQGMDTLGFLLSGAGVRAEQVGGGLRIRTEAGHWVKGSGVLLSLRFRAADPAAETTAEIRLDYPPTLSPFLPVSTPVRCTKPQCLPGNVTITSRKPELASCEIQNAPEVLYNREIQGYDPNPLLVEFSVANVGDREAVNTRAEITFDTAAFALAPGSTAMRATTPATLPPGWSGSARWELVPRGRSDARTFPVAVVARGDNAPPTQCTTQVTVHPFPPILSLSADPVRIRYDRPSASYNPMPVPVKARVQNVGYVPAELMEAELLIPSGSALTLDPSERGIAKKSLTPAALGNSGAAECQWLVAHPVTLEEKTYSLRLRTWGANTDTVERQVEVVVPAMEGPQILETGTPVPARIAFDSLARDYRDNPFLLSFRAVNNGGLDADSVRATLILPSGVAAEPAAQPMTQYFQPTHVDRWKAGTLPAVVAWNLRAIPHYSAVVETVKIRVEGISAGGQFEALFTYPVLVDSYGLTRISCSAAGQDSIFFSDFTGMTPNPFTICYRLRNESLLPVTLGKANVIHDLPGTVLESLLPAVLPVLPPGGEVNVCASLRTSPMLVQSRGKVYLEYTTVEDVMERQQCAKEVFIDSARIGQFPVLAMSVTPADSFRYDCSVKAYDPSVRTVTVAVVNTGAKIADSLSLRMILPSSLAAVPTADTLRPLPVILQQKIVSGDWQFQVATPPAADTMAPIEWRLERSGQVLVSLREPVFIADTICPAVSCSIPALAFRIDAGDSGSYEQSVRIGSRDGTPFAWSALTAVSWIDLQPTQGKNDDVLTVGLRARHLPAGKYNGTVVVATDVHGLRAELPVVCEVAGIISGAGNQEEKRFLLAQNYPNPFSDRTVIRVVAPTGGTPPATLKVYDAFGRQQLDLTAELRRESPGSETEIIVDQSRLPGAGVYICQLSAGSRTFTRVMIALGGRKHGYVR